MAMVSRLKIQRILEGHTLYTLEKRSGVPFWRLSLIENGLLPTPKQIVQISTALETDPAEIFPVFDSGQWEEHLVTL